MSVRLKIGSYIIDAADTGSTSTTTGVRLLLPGGPSLKWAEARETMEVTLAVQVSRDTTANLKTSLDALKAAVLNTVHTDLVFESASGTTLFSWSVSDNVFSRIQADIESDIGETAALCVLVFRATRIGTSSGSAGDPSGATDVVVWDVGMDANGRPTCSTQVTFKKRTDATAWVQTLRGGTRPAWMNTTMRLASVRYAFEQQQNAPNPVTEVFYTPAVVTVIFNALSAAYAASSAFNAVIDADCEISKTPRAPVDENAGTTPGYDIHLSGSLQFKTETDSTFDAADTTATAAAALKAAALACITVMENDAKTRHGEAWQRVAEPELAVSVKSGVVLFTLRGLTGDAGRILTWEEDLKITRYTRDKRVPGGTGDRVYPHRLGPELRCTHRLSLTALSVQEYPLPSFIANNPRWHEDFLTPGKPHVMVPEGSTLRPVSQTFEGQWTLLSNGSEQDRTETSFDGMAGGAT